MSLKDEDTRLSAEVAPNHSCADIGIAVHEMDGDNRCVLIFGLREAISKWVEDRTTLDGRPIMATWQRDIYLRAARQLENMAELIRISMEPVILNDEPDEEV